MRTANGALAHYPTKARLSVRRATYRNVEGWSLRGIDGRGRSCSMFFEHEAAARRTCTRMIEDPSYETSPSDFDA